MRTEQSFDRWLEYDEYGFASGIRADAPEDIKKEYETFLKEENARKKKGIKI